ncbi:MAG: 6-bladed beta-propeller [Acidobacteriota bacterium]|jgi:hypothetical protein
MSALLAVVLLSSCSRPPLEFADWIIQVPDGTPILEYAPVPLEERDPDAIRLTEELVVGAGLENPDEAVFQPTDIVATDDGMIFIADFSMNRVQMYDRDGRYLRTLGREGQGPGEFEWIWGMTVAGDMLVVDDRGNARFSTWQLDGEPREDHPKQVRDTLFDMQGLADGHFVARTTTTTAEGQVLVIGVYGRDGAALSRLAAVALPPPTIPDPDWSAEDIAHAFIELLRQPRRSVTVGGGRIVYLSPVEEYQVLAYRPEVGPAWALRVAGPRSPITPLKKRSIVEQAQRADPTVKEADFTWPGEDVAVLDMLADGRGRLCVITTSFFDGDPPRRVPVDVFSPDGERIAAGFLPARWAESPGYFSPPWTYAVGDYVYGIRETDSGETVAVRYRLELNQ